MAKPTSRSKQIQPGFFDMGLITRVAMCSTVDEAKALALAAVASQPNAKPENIKKATDVINSAKTVKALSISLANFMLAHPSEGLGMNP